MSVFDYTLDGFEIVESTTGPAIAAVYRWA
jgi:hypothetical protein